MILANAILGLEIFGTTWWVIAAILCVILLITIGIAYSDSLSKDFDDVIMSSFISIVASMFWPFILAIAVCVGVVSLPILIGKYLGRWAEIKEKKEKEKEKFMNQIDKMKKTKGVD